MSKDPLGRSKEIGALRKRMGRQLDIYGTFVDLDPKLEKRLAQAAEYSDFRRTENERQLESIKAVLAGYIFNEQVVVQGMVPDKNGMKMVSLSHFDAMLKAANMFLNAMNMQNKIWGLYAMPAARDNDAASTMNIRNVSIAMVQDLQRIAKKENLALPTSESRPADNGAPDLDPRRGVTG